MMTSMRLRRWAGAAAGLCAVAWGGEAAAVTPTCEITGCGSNTPILFGTPIIGLSLEGLPAENGVVLNPSLTRVRSRPPAVTPAHGRACQTGAKLGVRQGRLVGRDRRGECQDPRGMIFKLRVPVRCASHVPAGDIFPPGCLEPNPSIEVQVRIEEEDQVKTWELPLAHDVPTYRLVWHQLPSARAFAAEFGFLLEAQVDNSVCPERQSWMERWQTVAKGPLNPRAPKPSPEEREWRTRTDHLLVLQGESYRKHDAAIDRTRTGPDWINLACVGSSLAKMRLLGYDPMVDTLPTSTLALERQATLKMLTARYQASTSYTYAGVPLMWRHRSGRQFAGEPDGRLWSPSLVESHWGPDGARCVSHRRTWSAQAGRSADEAIARAMPEQADPKRRRAALQNGAMDDYVGAEQLSLRDAGVGSCDPVDDAAIWTTFPVDHTPHSPVLLENVRLTPRELRQLRQSLWPPLLWPPPAVPQQNPRRP
jgi:ADYC domain